MRHLSGRRRWLQRLSLAPVLFGLKPAIAARLAKTAAAAEGPFYPTPSMRHTDIDNDLVKIDKQVQEAGGEIVHLTGMVMDIDAIPLQDLRVEIWQCDVNGRYLHTRDQGRIARDAGFQGFGHTYTDQSGRYAFRTIKPVPYPGRTPHIHVKIFRNDAVLTTQFYLKDHPDNASDGLLRRLSAEQRAAVEMVFIEQDGRSVATVDIVC